MMHSRGSSVKPTCIAMLAMLSAPCTGGSYAGIPSALQQDQTPGNHGNAGQDPEKFRCELDPKLTTEDLPFFIPDIQGAWGAACGRNRGVFVLNPPDGHTYGCGNLPHDWGVETVSDITDLSKTQPSTALNAFRNLVDAIYNTTIGKTASACDFDALTVLTCGREEPWRTAPWYDQLKAPIRAVNIGGLFVLERWILPTFTSWGDAEGIHDQYSFSEKCEGLGTCNDLKDHWRNWYGKEDFVKMKEVGLNSVRIPVGWWYFAAKINIKHDPYIVPDEDLYEEDYPITQVIRWAKDAGLHVILDLHGAPGSQNGLDNSGLTSPDPNELVWGESWMYSPDNYGDTVRTLAAMAEYINHIDDKFSLDNVMAIELLNEPWAHLDLGRVRDFYVTGIESVRLVRPLMPIIIHDSFRGPMWATLLKDFPYENIVMDTHIYHGFNPADTSSDTAVTDRQKMYVHERMACSYTSMLRYQTCAALPVFVGEWSLAIDNCMPWLDSKFADYGQCDNLEMRQSSSWWTEHTRSFATRQIAMFEREMGWAFWTWKLEDYTEKHDHASKYWSFSLAVEHGFIDTNFPGDACLHPPVADWQNGGGMAPDGSDADLAATTWSPEDHDENKADNNADRSPQFAKDASQSSAKEEGASQSSTAASFILFAFGGVAGALLTIAASRMKTQGGDRGNVEMHEGTALGVTSWITSLLRGGYASIGEGEDATRTVT